MTADSPVIVALDFSDSQSVESLVDNLDPKQCRLKIGKELFTRCGPDIVEQLQHRGFEIFLDLKFHDIPNTVAGAVKAATEMGVWMVNVHASGGRRMMEAAAESIANQKNAPLLIAVTVLTSMDREDLVGIGIDDEPLEQVCRLARLTQDSGLDGVVCSALEVGRLRREVNSEFLLVTPGIRPDDSNVDDQRRVASPRAAIEAGSNYLVIGRPITRHQDPLASLTAINNSLK